MTPTLVDLAPPSPPEVESDRISELLGEVERLRAILWARPRCRRGRLVDDEVIQQHVQGFGLHHRFVSSWGALPWRAALR